MAFTNIKCCMLSHVQLFATLWTVAHQAPLLWDFPRQEYWRELPFPHPVDFPNSGIEFTSPSWQADSLPLSHQGSPYFYICVLKDKTSYV